MPTKLYRKACLRLKPPEKQALAKMLRWVASHFRVPATTIDGKRLGQNLRTESHLCGDAIFGNPTILAQFLRQLLKCGRLPTRTRKREEKYEEAYRTFAARGVRIPASHLPDRFLRYCASTRTAIEVIEVTLGKTARFDFERGNVPAADVFHQISMNWTPGALASLTLTRGTVAWATCEHPNGAPRNDATLLAQALALPLWTRRGAINEVMLEFSYPRDSVTNYRFPTVADAGTLHLFQPASEIAPDSAVPESCLGWTKPLGVAPPQPELVHDNASLTVLDSPPRFVGRILA